MTDPGLPFGGDFLRPPRPRLREALGAVTALDDALLDEALAAGSFTWTAQNGLEWQTRGPDGAIRPRWSGRPRQGAGSPAEAWECLAARGVIPDGWVGATHERRFHWSHDGATPSDIRACIALASDPEGVIEVEGLAREMVQRLAPWLSDRGVRVLWKVVALEGADEYWATVVPPGGPVLWSALAALEDPIEPRPAKGSRRVLVPAETPGGPQPMWDRRAPRGMVLRGARRLESLLGSWARRAAGLSYPESVRVGGREVPVPRSLWATPVGADDDFTGPLRAILARGYVVEWLGRRTITLVAPDIA